MTPFLSPSERNALLERLQSLKPDSPAAFGMMSSQHMVEHLAITFSLSNGNRTIEQTTNPRLGDITKRRLLGTDMAFPEGFKAPILPENETLPYQYAHLSEAIEMLFAEITCFEAYFANNPDAQPVHPVMGPLGVDEWVIFHQKHLTHHLRQFGV
jgi:hypothetical protein